MKSANSERRPRDHVVRRFAWAAALAMATAPCACNHAATETETSCATPSPPTALSLVSSTETSATIAWKASPSAGVRGYAIHRDGHLVHEVASSVLSYEDTGLSASTTYVYTVEAQSGCGSSSAPSTSLDVTIAGPMTMPTLVLDQAFTANAHTISTSEGAPYGETDFWLNQDLTTKYGYGPTAVQRTYICLNGMVSLSSCSSQPVPQGPLSQQMLDGIDTGLARFVGSGKKLLVRFIYNFGPTGAPDAPASVIATHVDQLAPILLKYKDIVFALQAGFIGTWGEWHDSTNGNDNAASRKVVLDAEKKHFAGVFPIQVRTPVALIDYLGSTVPDAAFGIHDDYYASDPVDSGTWENWGTTNSYSSAALQAYGAQSSLLTPFAGEFGALYPALQSCSALDAYSHTYNLQSLSLNIYPPSVGDELESENCATSFFDKVGTRIELAGARIEAGTSAGSTTHVELTLQNTGYGRVFRARPVTLVLRSGAQIVAKMELPLDAVDLRKLDGGKPAMTFVADVTTPVDLAQAGPLTAALWIPDPAPTLVEQAVYALPLNSVDAQSAAIFEASTGLNVLGTLQLSTSE